jgi:hypothetical protein
MAFVEFDADEVMQEFGEASVVSELAGIVRADLGGYVRDLEAAHAAGNLYAGVRHRQRPAGRRHGRRGADAPPGGGVRPPRARDR